MALKNDQPTTFMILNAQAFFSKHLPSKKTYQKQLPGLLLSLRFGNNHKIFLLNYSFVLTASVIDLKSQVTVHKNFKRFTTWIKNINGQK